MFITIFNSIRGNFCNSYLKYGIDSHAYAYRKTDILIPGGKYTLEISKPLLTKSHWEKRLQWVKKHQNSNWNQHPQKVWFSVLGFGSSASEFFGRDNLDRLLQEEQKKTKSLKGELVKEWHHLSPDLAKKLVDSMRHHV
ncbi:hypothetical protein Glove_21g384 [Diversispora epigaea]|uniref:Uncharacterized protein n=1 Tax=Diversispora epigaea TaxID=1348612 RepID=A0A397JNG9_9GLOM|nr:hypothetical protein Glove_21g384 [Diversispora epigaea]